MLVDHAVTSGLLRFGPVGGYRGSEEAVEHPVPTPPPGTGWKVISSALGPREGDVQRIAWTWARRNPADLEKALQKFRGGSF